MQQVDVSYRRPDSGGVRVRTFFGEGIDATVSESGVLVIKVLDDGKVEAFALYAPGVWSDVVSNEVED